MKPTWANSPDWANWLARDDYGTWWWFEKDPIVSDDGMGWDGLDGKVEIAPSDFLDTLEPRPQEVKP